MNNTPRLLALASAILLLGACGEDTTIPTPNPGQASFRVSECGGFAGQSKSAAPVDYCAAEVLDWRYDAAAQKLVLADQRAVLNCCGERSLAVRVEDGVTIVTETDAPAGGGGRCRCDCSYDFEATLPKVAAGPLRLRLERVVTDSGAAATVLFDGTLDLSQAAGVEVLDSSATSFCNPPAPAPTPKPLPQTPTVSECGGFAATAKSDGAPPLAYCDAETLTFTHDAATGTLELQNDRILLNCCGDRGITATLEDGVYVLRETDAPEGGSGRCNCMCVFDFKVSVQGVPAEAIKVQLERTITDDNASAGAIIWTGSLDLTQKSGSVVVDATDVAPWCQN